MILRKLENSETYKNQQLSRNNGFTEHLNVEKLEKYLPTNKNANIIDVGCRSGQTVQSLIKRGYINAYGLDLGDTTWNTLPDDIKSNFIKCDIHNGIPLKTKFDLISCSHMLEHVHDPNKVIEELKSKLNDHGVLYISVPLDYVNRGMKHDPHYTFFESENDFRQFLEKSDLKVIELYTNINGPGGSPEVISFCKLNKKMKISFIQPSRNNLKYLKWSYDAIRKNSSHKEHEICVADDFSNDGTEDWCKERAEKDPHFKYIRNNGPTRLGHTILYDRLINEVATNDVVIIYHADMYACPNFDKYIEKYIKPGTIVSLTRIEPPLHPPGPEKICIGFGQEPEEFKEENFLKWFNETKISRKDKITEGIFAPWAIYKKDFQSIGGHDDLYAPQSKEDSDIFNRFLINGYSFVQTWEGCVYHMTCRGSRYNPTITTVGKESDEWLAQNNKSARNFIRKWGHFVKHNDTMKPIVPNRYDVGFVVLNCDEYKLALLEPWCDTIYTDVPYERYIQAEQKNTKFNLTKKLKRYEEQKINDIVVSFDANKLTNQSFEFFNMIQMMLEDSGQIGELEYDIFKLKINKLESHSKELINIEDKWYQNKLV